MHTYRKDHLLRRRHHGIAGLVLLACVALPALAQEPAPGEETGPDVDWVVGPATGELGGISTVQVPEGFIFAGPEDTRKLMLAMQNPVNGSEKGFIAPMDTEWFVVFEYDPVGYIKDDDREDLDADALLKSIREGQAAGNKVRAEKGWETLEIKGWMQPPHYDPESNNLEWGTLLQSSSGAENVNYNSRLLGRGGVMSAILVGSEDQIRENLPVFRSMLNAHDYVEGKRYAEFRDGDKLAEYGLAALVTGGAAAVALKTGLFKKLWKFIALGVAAGVAALRKLFGRSSERIDPSGTGSDGSNATV